MSSVEIEFRVAHPRFGLVQCRLGRSLLRKTLLHVLESSRIRLLQGLSTGELGICQFESRSSRRNLSGALVKFDLIRSRIDREQESTLPDYAAILESDIGKCAPDLRPQFDLIHGRELTEKL